MVKSIKEVENTINKEKIIIDNSIIKLLKNLNVKNDILIKNGVIYGLSKYKELLVEIKTDNKDLTDKELLIDSNNLDNYYLIDNSNKPLLTSKNISYPRYLHYNKIRVYDTDKFKNELYKLTNIHKNLNIGVDPLYNTLYFTYDNRGINRNHIPLNSNKKVLKYRNIKRTTKYEGLKLIYYSTTNIKAYNISSNDNRSMYNFKIIYNALKSFKGVKNITIWYQVMFPLVLKFKYKKYDIKIILAPIGI